MAMRRVESKSRQTLPSAESSPSQVANFSDVTRVESIGFRKICDSSPSQIIFFDSESRVIPSESSQNRVKFKSRLYHWKCAKQDFFNAPLGFAGFLATTSLPAPRYLANYVLHA